MFPPVFFHHQWPDHYRIVWWSSDPSVASVSQSGEVSAHRSGMVEIWVQVESARDSGTLIVRPGPDRDDPRYMAVTSGLNFTCGLAVDRSVYCWGSDSVGQHGRERTGFWTRWWTGHASPALGAGGGVYSAITAGEQHTCGLATDGVAHCWGYNWHGQLGDGTHRASNPEGEGRAEPRPVIGGRVFQALTAAASSTCGLDNEGRPYCWGSNLYGQLGIGYVTVGVSDRRLEPTEVVGEHRFATLAAGIWHKCGLTAAGEAYCWGVNHRAQLGNLSDLQACGGAWPCTPTPVPVVGGHTFVSLAAGVVHTCGLTAAGHAYCWGGNGQGQLGSDAESTHVPQRVEGIGPLRALVANGFHSCGLDEGGRAYCWGENLRGQLGNGTTGGATPSPQEVRGDLTFTSLGPGVQHTCGVTADGEMYCWGWGHSGRVGNGMLREWAGGGIANMVTVPVRVESPFPGGR